MFFLTFSECCYFQENFAISYARIFCEIVTDFGLRFLDDDGSQVVLLPSTFGKTE